MVDEKLMVSVGKGAKKTTWAVVDDIMETDLPDTVPYLKDIGITGFDFANKEVRVRHMKHDHINFPLSSYSLVARELEGAA